MDNKLTCYAPQNKQIAIKEFGNKYRTLFEQIHSKILYEMFADKRHCEGRAYVETIQVDNGYMCRVHCSDGAYFETPIWPNKFVAGCDVRARCQNWHDKIVEDVDKTVSEPEKSGPDIQGFMQNVWGNKNGTERSRRHYHKKHPNAPYRGPYRKRNMDDENRHNQNPTLSEQAGQPRLQYVPRTRKMCKQRLTEHERKIALQMIEKK